MSTTTGKNNWRLCEFVAHGSNVNCLALSPSNGRTLATGGDDRRINLWAVGQPNALMSISGITSPVQSVVFNNTENWIGAGSKSGVVKVFDLDENKAVRSISGHKAAVCSLDFHRYGDILASGSLDTNVKLWDVRRKGCIFTYKGHSDAINSIEFSPDGKWIVSASGDGTAKVWDLSAGRMIADFTDHTAAVTTIQFHPKEFLLATGSADRTAVLWDLERFETVSVCGPESTTVRCVMFHPEGSALFSGAQDSLKTYTWEPATTHDMVPVHWGKVADMAVSGEQLIGASFAQTIVSLWCIDLKKVRPFSGDPASPVQKAAPILSASGRRHFEYKQEEVPSRRPLTQASQPHPPSSQQQQTPQRPSSEEWQEGGGRGGGGGEGGDSPPIELKAEEREKIFSTRQKLIRTPPKEMKQYSPFYPPSTNDILHVHDMGKGREAVRREKQEDRRVEVVGGGRRAEVVGRERRVEKVGGERRVEKGVGRDRREGGGRGGGGGEGDMVRDFLPKPKLPSQPLTSQSSVEKMLQRDINTNHSDVCSILESRLQVLRDVRSHWSLSNPKSSVEAVLNSGNQAALVDLLNVLLLRRTLWSLDIAVLVLPEIKLLLKSKYEMYVRCGCNVVKLILKSFGPVIRTNLSTPPAQGGRGVDLSREERYEKCNTCYSHLILLRQEAERHHRDSTMVGKVIRSTSLLDSFSVLD